MTKKGAKYLTDKHLINRILGTTDLEVKIEMIQLIHLLAGAMYALWLVISFIRMLFYQTQYIFMIIASACIMMSIAIVILYASYLITVRLYLKRFYKVNAQVRNLYMPTSWMIIALVFLSLVNQVLALFFGVIVGLVYFQKETQKKDEKTE